MIVTLAVLAVVGPGELLSLTNKPIHIFPSKARHGVVAFFVLADCPIARAYAPELKRIKSKYEPKGFEFKLVYTDSLTSFPKLQRNAKEYGYGDWAFYNAGLMQLAQVQISPSAALFDPQGKLIYSGRIDNLYAGIGKRRAKATSFDLRDALDATLQGRKPTMAKTTAVGCVIPSD